MSYPQSADLDALRSQIGIIPQDPAMFAGTLRENIDPFERYSDSEVSVAIAECGLEHRSMDSTVGVSGENFSLGEKQLVSCALALRCNRNPPYSIIPTGMFGTGCSDKPCTSCSG